MTALMTVLLSKKCSQFWQKIIDLWAATFVQGIRHDQLRICLHFSSCWMMEMVKSHWILDMSGRFRAFLQKTRMCEGRVDIEMFDLFGN